MSWLLVIILAYLSFSLASLGDKLVLNRAKNPKLYAFYVGFLSLLVLSAVPFVGIRFPDVASFLWIFLSSGSFIFGLYVLYNAVEKFEVSRVVPIVGALQPIFILFLSFMLLEFGMITASNMLAFAVLLLAGIIISFEKKLKVTKKLLELSLFASLLIALSFVFIKLVFLHQSFFHGIIWIGIFNFLFALVFLFDAGVRSEIFVKKSAFDKKTLLLVIITQSAGGLAGLLQNFAIFLAPVSNLAILNALRGIQYMFLFVITLFFSFFYPKILKEEISRKIIIQKSVVIIMIVFGLAILFFF